MCVKKCTKCNKEYIKKDDYKFCPLCGNKLKKVNKQYIVEVFIRGVEYANVDEADKAYDEEREVLNITDLEYQFTIDLDKRLKLDKFVKNKMWRTYND